MKILLFSSVLMVSTALYAQPKLVSQATITTSTNVIAPEDEDVSQIQNQGGGGFNFRNFGDGETKSTTYVKNDLVKTVFKSESFRGVVYRDNAKKVTRTVFENMGTKQGIIASDEDQADMRKRIDSAMKARENADTNATKRVRTVDVSSTITYVDETKKIAGYNCKKALIITDRFISKDTLVVWYTPELKFPNVSSTGGTSGFGNFGNQSANSFDKIDGFVMQYQRNMPRGRVMEVKVTKIDIEKELADKEFELPKDVEFKTMKEMSGGAGGQQFRFGGGRN